MKHILISIILITASLLAGCIPAKTVDTSPIQTEEPPSIPDSTPAPTMISIISDEQAIKEALATYFEVDGSSFSHFEVKENTGAHARGGVDNGYFLAAKVDGQWVFVGGGHVAPDCNTVAQYGFPASMVLECDFPSSLPSGSDEEAIRAALAAHFGIDESEFYHFEVNENTGTHAKGGVDNGYFLAAKVDGQWVFVDGGQSAPDCNAVAQYDFPASMVPGCPSGGSNMPDCPGVGVLAATFIADVTYPDGSVVSPGQSFTKTWRIKNAGTCTWNADYQIVFDSGEAMGGPAFQQLTTIHIPPGETLDISIKLLAPATPGTYRGNWKLRAPNSDIFGLTTDNPIWVEIKVVE